MTTLPRGTVTFLMTDIEGSTRLAASVGATFAQILDAHFALLDAAVSANGGTVVSSEGDALFAVFTSVREAIAAAIEAQRAIEGHAWPGATQVRVRMGIHAGEALFGGRDYTGLEVHRTARIAAAAWGGEIIVSEAARALASELPDGVSLRDLGEHRLRDLPAPERLYQLCASGLTLDFPPPRTMTGAGRGNLPAPLTRFIGRQRELADVRQLLGRERLVTLTGPGGTGKTRLAIALAHSVEDEFPDGVWFVALDTVRDPALVIPTIAQVLGIAEQPGRAMGVVLAEALAEKRALVVLDNLEQVIDAAPEVAALLAGTRSLIILGSSREPLGIAGENVYPVPTLGLPSEPGRPTAADLEASDSVQLFVERARAAKPGFVLTDENAPAIAAICRRLDGLPLALELAAARVNLLAPAQLLERLDHRLSLVAGARRDMPDRQRTLRGAIDWSYELLADAERAVFRRFAVFAGGADLDALLAIIDPDGATGPDALDLLGSLVDRSLVRSGQEFGAARFDMLETIHEYAAEKLAESGETASVSDRHADFYADVAAAASNVLSSADRDERLNHLDREMPNLRAALEWSISTVNWTRAARMAVGLKDFWRTRGHMAEMRRMVAAALDASAVEGPTRARSDMTGVLAELSAWHGAYQTAREASAAQIAMLEELGDRRGLANALSSQAWGNLSTRPEVSREAFIKSVAIAREEGDLPVLLGAVQGLAIALLRLGDMPAAREMANEAIEVGVVANDEYTNAFNYLTLGLVEHHTGHLAAAAGRFGEALSRAQSAGSRLGIVVAIDIIAMLALERGDVDKAALLAATAQKMRTEIGGVPSMALVGLQPIVEQVRERDPVAYQQAEVDAATTSVDDAVRLAHEIVAATSNAGSSG